MTTAAFRRPFDEQVAAFRLRLRDLRPTARWDDLWQAEHDRAFMVAGAVKADLLADLAAAVDRAIAEGTGIDAFRRDFRAIVEKHGWHGWTGEGTAKGEAWRTRVIYQTNLRTSYMAGRHAQLVAGDYPLWVYRHGGSREPRLDHLGWDGLILPPDHPFWATHFPPNGWGCNCRVFGARSVAGAVRRGGKPGLTLPDGWAAPSPKTGAPSGIDRGWAYAPGATVAETVNRIVAGKVAQLPAPIGAALFHSVAASRAPQALIAAWTAFVTEALATRVQQRAIIIGALKPARVAAAEANGIRLASAEIAVTDRNILHTFRGTDHVRVPGARSDKRKPKVDPLPMDWYLGLPDHLRSPQAVLMDLTQKEPVFLLVFEVPGARTKLVVEVNTWVKKLGSVLNTVQSGRLVQPNDIASLLGRGVTLIEGGI